MIAGNDGGAAALGVRVQAFVSQERVAESFVSYNIGPGEQGVRPFPLHIPFEYVADVIDRGDPRRGVPVFTGAIRIRAVTASGADDAWWPSRLTEAGVSSPTAQPTL